MIFMLLLVVVVVVVVVADKDALLLTASLVVLLDAATRFFAGLTELNGRFGGGARVVRDANVVAGFLAAAGTVGDDAVVVGFLIGNVLVTVVFVGLYKQHKNKNS